MQKYFCDVCGKEFVPQDGAAAGYDALMACPNVVDVCPKCAAKGKALNVEKIVLAAWTVSPGKRKGRRPKAADGVSKPVGRPKSKAQDVKAVDGEDGDGAEPAESEGGDGSVGDRNGGVSAAVPIVIPETPSPCATVPNAPSAPTAKPKPPSVISDGKKTAPAAKRSGFGSEKRAILDKLIAYRRRMGLGAMDAVAREAGISDSTIMGMLNAMPQDISVWRQVGNALDKLAADEDVNRTEM